MSPDLAQTFLGAKYKPGKDYEKSEFRVDSWETVSARLYAFLTADIVRNFAGSDFTAHDLYFAEKPVFVFISFHESDLLSMAPLIKFVCESLMMELLNAYDNAPDEMKAKPGGLSGAWMRQDALAFPTCRNTPAQSSAAKFRFR